MTPKKHLQPSSFLSPSISCLNRYRIKIALTQFHDSFCVDTRSRINEGVLLSFDEKRNGILCHQVTHGQIGISIALRQHFLYIHHYERLDRHRNGRKPYQSIRQDMYWPPLAVECYAIVRRCPIWAKIRINNMKTFKICNFIQTRCRWSQ